MDELDQAILFLFATLTHETGKFTTAVVLDHLTADEQEHYAKRFLVLSESLNERAARTRKRASKGNVSDIGQLRGDKDSKAG